MYKITKNGAIISLEDKARYTKHQANGVDVLCAAGEADGIVINNDYIESLDGMTVSEFNGANTIATMLPELTDQTASGFVDLYPSMKYDGKLIPAGTRINWNGWLKQATVDLWDTEENDPDHAPTLWVKINYKDGVRVIPDPITASEVFKMDELGWWDGGIYKSLLNSNVYTPEQYAAGWELHE